MNKETLDQKKPEQLFIQKMHKIYCRVIISVFRLTLLLAILWLIFTAYENNVFTLQCLFYNQIAITIWQSIAFVLAGFYTLLVIVILIQTEDIVMEKGIQKFKKMILINTLLMILFIGCTTYLFVFVETNFDSEAMLAIWMMRIVITTGVTVTFHHLKDLKGRKN